MEAKRLNSICKISDKPTSEDLLTHLQYAVESCKTSNAFIAEFYTYWQCRKVSEDSFRDKLEILSSRVISICSSWKEEADKTFKNQYADYL